MEFVCDKEDDINNEKKAKDNWTKIADFILKTN